MQAHNAALKKAQKRKHANDRAKQRNEKLARRNPFRLERQVNALQSIPTELRSQHEIKQLEELEKELRLIKKARKEMGIDDDVPNPKRPQRKGRPEDDDESDTDESVRGIPLPPGPLPPLPGQDQKKQVVYEAKPVLRDLQKEAAKFVPTVVRKKVGEGAAESVQGGKNEEKAKTDGSPAAEDDELAKFERELQEVEVEEEN